MRPPFCGWIKAEPEFKKMLLSIRVKVGKYDPVQRRFINCFMSEGAYKRLQALGHLFEFDIKPSGPPPPKPEPRTRFKEWDDERW